MLQFLVGGFVLFLNLIPLLELDGYWILSDWLRMPNLRPDSLAFVRHDVSAKLRRRERFSRGEVGLALYGTVGVAFTVFLLVTLPSLLGAVFAPGAGSTKPDEAMNRLIARHDESIKTYQERLNGRSPFFKPPPKYVPPPPAPPKPKDDTPPPPPPPPPTRR
jgi:hypothetical protein